MSATVRRSMRRLVPVVAGLLLVAGCGSVDLSPSDEAAEPTVEVTDEIVACADAPDAEATDATIDLGALRVGAVADAERVAVDDGVEIRFAVVVEAIDPDTAELVDEIAILQARAQDADAVLLRADDADAAGAEQLGVVAALSFARCDSDVRHEVVLTVAGDGCPVLVGNDPATGGFTELPVRVGVDACPAG